METTSNFKHLHAAQSGKYCSSLTHKVFTFKDGASLEDDFFVNCDSFILKVPSTNPGRQSSMMTVNYSLDLTIITPGMSNDLVVSLPIVIGSIPVQY